MRIPSLFSTACWIAGACLLAGIAAQPAGALPLISEVLYDASGSDDGYGFVELFAAAGSSLDGLVLEGINGSGGTVTHTITLSGSVPADGLFVVADRTSGGATFVPGADLLADFDLQNGPDSLRLRGPGGVIDAVGYGSFGAGDVFAGEGSPAPDGPAGTSLARLFANLDTGDNALDFVVLATPTPGSAAVTSVPEPLVAGWLAAAGMLGLAAVGRRIR